MSTPKDGGPAFPEYHYFDPQRGQYGMHMTASDVGCGGMTLRDYFAGQALAGMCHRIAQDGYPIEEATETAWAATAAYLFADAMLAASGRKEGK
jgi:hypothetical protein